MLLQLNDISVEIIRKPIKHIYIRIDSNGFVKLSAPIGCTEHYIKRFVSSRQDWIRKHTRALKSRSEAPSFMYVSGEHHLYLGNSYPISIQSAMGKNKIILSPPLLHFFVKENTTKATMEKMINAWYRSELKKILPTLIAKWEPILGVKVKEWGIKRMKTRWGTCNPHAERIWLNLSLIKKPIRCLEYVVVHEMVHLLEASHNKRFYALMDQFLPEWQSIRRELKST
ncbi:M48 family metallopeptidase [Legionella impletisoli]|uniref:Zinc metalloprotease n=1 Tax=Legionella impletisoli TaxID=343510 RepID=A0A917N8J3_9GAMM|nr:SprT family zinc-dependent metalloprotease [Legionella impletisoli]GGI77978.1 zinc metalloprotease [Legionella impletisoli]